MVIDFAVVVVYFERVNVLVVQDYIFGGFEMCDFMWGFYVVKSVKGLQDYICMRWGA